MNLTSTQIFLDAIADGYTPLEAQMMIWHQYPEEYDDTIQSEEETRLDREEACFYADCVRGIR